ncbi:MAG: hypothetical protein HQK49_15650 [Oligoflexia bacterium]|nr:hypothetical protein [Oligoflexia bacterium]
MRILFKRITITDRIQVISFLFVIIILLELIFFRDAFFPQFHQFVFAPILDGLIGNSGDARLNTLIMEHWYDFYRGISTFKELPVFYPNENALGYTDLLIAYSWPYAFFRAVGADIFRAQQLTLILLHLIGTLALIYLLIKKFKFNIFFTSIATIIIFFSNSYYLNSHHTQLFAFSFLPFLGLLIFSLVENINNQKKRICYAIFSILFLNLLFYTSFYIAYFTLFFIFIFSLVTAIIFRILYKEILNNSQILKRLKEIKLELLCYFSTFVITLIPFFLIYLPVMKEAGKRPWGEVRSMLPSLIDYINISYSNLTWGPLLHLISPSLQERVNSIELESGFPLITFFLFWLAFFYYIKKLILLIRSKSKNENLNTIVFHKMLINISLSISVFVMLVLQLKFSNDFSLWWNIYRYFPGGSAIRVVARANLFLTFPMAIVICTFLSSKLKKKILLTFLIAVLFLENINLKQMCKWNISDIRKTYWSTTLPPTQCKIFYIIEDPANTLRNDHYNYQLDAWMIASRFNIKTLNGYSGQSPIGWSLFEVNNSSKYYIGVQAWISKHKLTDVCSYNLSNYLWSIH